jgi:MFS superfamily sulfate permease-like transporter
VANPPHAFARHALPPLWAGVVAAGALLLLLLTARRLPISLVLVCAGIAIAVVTVGRSVALGPSHLVLPSFSRHTFWVAVTLLVIPQLPLSFANSCLATADAARTYFGDRAARVTPGRLATTFGAATTLAGLIGGMPVCHGAGGVTAHYRFGARRAAAPMLMGTALLVLALGFGAGLATLLTAFPLPILAALLTGAGLFHIALLRDLSGVHEWLLALVVGLIGFQANLALSLCIGLAAWWLWRGGLTVRRALQPAGS